MNKKIVVLGGGVLGSQIAFQTAYCGFNVTVWLIDEESCNQTKIRINELKEKYILMINDMAKKEKNSWMNGISDFDSFNKEECLKKVEQVSNKLKLELDLKKSIKDADIVIESIIENIDAKKELYNKIAPFLTDKTIVVTNSSTILPSKLAKSTGKESNFLSLHFANSIWKNNITEIMIQPKTSEDIFNKVIEFAKEIKMIPLPIKKEKSGYLLNSMLIPLLFSALDLYVNGISDPLSIDKAWTIGTGSPKGPFAILDTIGLGTAYNIVSMYAKVPSFLAPYNFKGMQKLLKEYIDSGKMGVSSKEGFYKYD